MCGRFAFFSPAEAVSKLFSVEFPLELEPRYNITPGNFILTLRADQDRKPEAAVLKWGLVPSWAREPSIGHRLINARAETAAEKPSFRTAFRRRRCVILADGFFEWRVTGDGKVPYFITHAKRGPLAMAGLWEHWQGPDGEELETCTILTAAANPLLAPLHHRMPINLSPAASHDWLGVATDNPEAAREILRTSDNEQFEYWPVSRAVNNPRNDGAELIERDEP